MLPGQLPTYDPKKDGNPFEWIVKAAQVVRERNSNDAQVIRLQRAIQERRRCLPAVIE